MTAADTARPAIRMTDLVAAELTKIRSLPATWIALAVAVVANGALGFIAATDVVRLAGDSGPTSIAQIGTLMLAPVYAFLAIAVFAAGTEYRGGQLRLSLAAVPGRGRFLTAKLLATLAASLVAAVLVVLPSLVLREALGDLGRYLVAYLLLALIGYGLAFTVRTVVTPIAVLSAFPILISTTLGGLWPEAVRLLPHEAALSLLGMPADPATTLSPGAGLLVLAAWAAGSVAAAWILVIRRDV
ncbi:ABC transporter [Micromonospora sonchi]|uniref:ABC transporter n=1 Tax=Micromonospora sonchi TaxID=1763543 RepID=A0A917TZY8_9ACTN|nr:ABC transporter [Micromonospora sonchi]GGM47442.1 ABC transporter [Micromonospora sonchi]